MISDLSIGRLNLKYKNYVFFFFFVAIKNTFSESIFINISCA